MENKIFEYEARQKKKNAPGIFLKLKKKKFSVQVIRELISWSFAIQKYMLAALGYLKEGLYGTVLTPVSPRHKAPC